MRNSCSYSLLKYPHTRHSKRVLAEGKEKNKNIDSHSSNSCTMARMLNDAHLFTRTCSSRTIVPFHSEIIQCQCEFALSCTNTSVQHTDQQISSDFVISSAL